MTAHHSGGDVDLGHGAIVLAAYRPSPELFLTQLRSIQSQTHQDFVCLVGADGDPETVRALVAEAVPGDSRFAVIGWDDRVGFYLNFERLLLQVPADVAWVALSDQDDEWRSDKLATLLPRLTERVLVTGQARVVRHPKGSVLIATTRRRVVAPADLLLHNQVSGALAVFRRELLDLALPFPRMHTVTQLHDHWLAMCSTASGGYAVVDSVVQDYVQHGDNLIGEVTSSARPMGPLGIVRRIGQLSDTYEGSHGPRAALLTCQRLSFGWRRLVLDTLRARRGVLADDLEPVWARLNSSHLLAAASLPLRGLRSKNVDTAVVATFFAGLPGELLLRIDDRSGWRRSGRRDPTATTRGDGSRAR